MTTALHTVGFSAVLQVTTVVRHVSISSPRVSRLLVGLDFHIRESQLYDEIYILSLGKVVIFTSAANLPR